MSKRLSIWDVTIGELISIILALLVISPLISFFTNPFRPMSKREVAGVWVTVSGTRALQQFRTDVGRYPSTVEGLGALLRAPKDTPGWKGPYLEGSQVPLDAWGHEFRYRFPNQMSTSGYDLWSLGPDGLVSEDDIGNWKR